MQLPQGKLCPEAEPGQAVFRAMLLAHPAVDGVLPGPLRLAAAAAMPLGVFIAYHLVNPQEQARQTFRDWRFLTMAGASRPPCSMHWQSVYTDIHHIPCHKRLTTLMQAVYVDSRH